MTKGLPRLELHQGDGDWSALYVDGNLEVVGDHYLCEEKIYTLAGVEVVYGDDFMRGGRNGNDVAKTTDEVNEYRRKREAAEKRAEELERQAKELQLQARELRVRAGR